jgi:ribosome-associated protein
MRKLYQNHTSQQLAEVVIQGMLERKAKDITVMDLRKIGTAVCDYYVICHGNSNTHVESIAESVGYETRKHLNDKPVHVEGTDVAEWILLDYADVVVHVFQEKSRRFYNLEQLWADAEISTVNESMTN